MPVAKPQTIKLIHRNTQRKQPHSPLYTIIAPIEGDANARMFCFQVLLRCDNRRSGGRIRPSDRWSRSGAQAVPSLNCKLDQRIAVVADRVGHGLAVEFHRGALFVEQDSR